MFENVYTSETKSKNDFQILSRLDAQCHLKACDATQNTSKAVTIIFCICSSTAVEFDFETILGRRRLHLGGQDEAQINCNIHE